jgi:hypothetical protein
MNEKPIVLAATLVSIRYFPDLSVSVPTVVPFKETDAKGMGSPVRASTILPLTIVFSCVCEKEFRLREKRSKKYTEVKIILLTCFINKSSGI